MSTYYKFFVLLLLGASTSAFGAMREKAPSHGFLVGSTDKDFIKYDCSLNQEKKLVCSFDQVHITPKEVKYDDIQNQQALVEFRSKMISEDCPAVLKDSAEFNSKINNLPEGEREDMLMVRNALRKPCNNPTDENILAFVDTLRAQDRLTCTLRQNHFEQIFELSPRGTWTAVTTPDGICGTVYIASFEPVDGFLWKYKSRSIDTVKYPDTDNMLLQVCNKPDEKEYEFTTQNAVFKNCRYIGWW